MADDSVAGGRPPWGRGFHVGVDGSVDAVAYDRYIGRWSRMFVAPLLDAAAVGSGDVVLDVATGTGEAAVGAARHRARGVVGADIALGMLTAATERLAADRYWPVAADGQVLPFSAGVFDVVVCQLGLMFFADPGRALGEFRRVVRVDGRVAVSVLGSPGPASPWGVLADVLGRHLPQQTADLHIAFRLGDPGHLARLLGDAGFAGVRVVHHVRHRSFDSFDEYWAPIEAGAGQLPRVYQSLPTATRDDVRSEVRKRLGPPASDGRLELDVEVLIGAGAPT